MFNHHEHHEQLSEAERERLLREGAVTRGIVMQSELSATDRGRSHVRVEVSFKDGQTVQFDQELANLYQPVPGSQEARRLAEVRGAEQLRHPDRIPKIQLTLSDGARIPVRYDAANRARLAIDVPALQQRALHDYIEREQRQKGQPTARKGRRRGPALGGADALPELRRAGRPGEGLARGRPAVLVLRSADTGQPALALAENPGALGRAGLPG